jgi:hypothetical protein
MIDNCSLQHLREVPTHVAQGNMGGNDPSGVALTGDAASAAVQGARGRFGGCADRLLSGHPEMHSDGVAVYDAGASRCVHCACARESTELQRGGVQLNLRAVTWDDATLLSFDMEQPFDLCG